ncbi:MAG: type IV pilus assembly protein PilC, partial [Ilumatobacter sp.]
DRELDSRIKKFTTMFEPIMIVFVGVIVGFVAIALVSAMYGVLGGIKEKA